MNFMEAVKVMKNGFKVRRKEWMNDEQLWIEEKHILTNKNLNDRGFFMNIESADATDWEIVEEKKSLSEQVHFVKCMKEDIMRDQPNYFEEDVNEAIKEFIDAIDSIRTSIGEDEKVKQKAKEIFGERLVRS